MVKLLLRLFVRNYEDTKDPAVRNATGNLASVTGIVCNVLLFAVKLIIGQISMSVSITADAFNNLSDASSNIISMVSFKIASMPADDDHPYGHARFEYIASLAAAVMIILVGWELGRSSIEKIMHPDVVVLTVPMIIAMAASVLVKLWMMVFNRVLGSRISSPVLLAASADSRNDIISTSAVVLGALASSIWGLKIDGWLGLGVSLFIFCSGIGFIREATSLIMGEGISREEKDELISRILSYRGVLGVHDVMLHDYGTGHRFGSLHIEMDSSLPPMESHDIIDNIERDLKDEMGIAMSIHHDPVLVGDERTDRAKEMVEEVLKGVSERLRFHDFRAVWGPDHTNLVFDVVVPFDEKMSFTEIKKAIDDGILKTKNDDTRYYTVITFDRDSV
ncbi:MAG: cation transporter [Eubacteriaceae bacterium]|nr:cation transporter [Eubacteriaceae bacterium]